MGWIDTYLNQPSIKAELGVNPQREFSTCNLDVNRDFTLNGDWDNYALLLPELVNGGVRLLVYAGNAGEYPYSAFPFFLSWDCTLHFIFIGLRLRLFGDALLLYLYAVHCYMASGLVGATRPCLWLCLMFNTVCK